MGELDRQVMLRVIDTRWMGYLQEMDYLKQGIGLRGFGPVSYTHLTSSATPCCLPAIQGSWAPALPNLLGSSEL